MKPDTFIFESYDFDITAKRLRLKYAYNNGLHFTETYSFDFPFADFDQKALDKACSQLFLIAGISYYKAYLPPQIVVTPPCVDPETAAFLQELYRKGLGELHYVNKLDPNIAVHFPVNSRGEDSVPANKDMQPSYLVGIGGGKDSLVAVEALRNQKRVATWSLNHRQILEPLIKTIGLTHYYVDRDIDSSIKDLPSSYNGHVPISAIIAATGTIVALLTGTQDVVVANEFSANEPTLEYQGVAINHQYSKTSDFEQRYRQLLRRSFGETVRYYSILRPFSELYITELFSKFMPRYETVFSSCNKAFVHGSTKLSWCGECPKCAFIFLVLACYIPQQDLERLFGKNLLSDPQLAPLYQQLLGITGDKPLDCVGEIQESRYAMQTCIAKGIVSEDTYTFDPVTNYNPRQIHPHHMPTSVWQHVLTFLG